MHKINPKLGLLTLLLLFCFFSSVAQDSKPDTVYTGVYVTSIHDIDFRQKEYSISFWLWLKYKNKDFDFANNLEIPGAKSFSKSFSTIDSSDGRVYLLMKLQCVMKDSWRINNFPFDYQNLRLSIENSQYDSKSLVFSLDSAGEHYDKRFALSGWVIDSFHMITGIRKYETAFGDDSYKTPHTEYSAFRIRIGIKRDAMSIFWKLFLGMYVAFLIAYICFYIHADNIDSRFGLSVGSLFAVIGNKYIIDSALPESTSFTLVDMLHGVTLFFIFLVVSCSAYALRLIKKDKAEKAHRFDLAAAQGLLLLYVLANVYFIYKASRGA